MGRHIPRALLIANRPEGWELVENLLIAAQRQEGLRQVILETVDEANPQAFQRMLRIIVEQNLVRFSATIRAVDVWVGLGWDVEQRGWVQETVELLLELLEHPEQQHQALQSDRPNFLYLALWTLAFEEVDLAIQPALELLKSGTLEQRFVAAYLLRQISTDEARTAIAPSLEDENFSVAAQLIWPWNMQTNETKILID